MYCPVTSQRGDDTRVERLSGAGSLQEQRKVRVTVQHYRELRDPVHGFIRLNETEAGIIDTPVFQRLRRIRQLATAYLVYPGALHTRFEHSLGVMHVAGQMADRLIDDDPTQERRRRIRLAALLHDLGHGPFSHVSEEILDIYYDRSNLMFGSKPKIHEKITKSIVQSDKRLAHYLSPNELEAIVDLLDSNAVEHIDGSIISGPLDADKQDYLLRDSYFCGVKYGVFDQARLVAVLEVVASESKENDLAVAGDGVYTVEQFSLARYYMHSQVYGHKVRRVSDSMIVRALKLGIEVDKLEWLRDIFSYDVSPEYIEEYLQWDDQRLMHCLMYEGAPDLLSKKIMLRMSERRLFKIVFSKPIKLFTPPGLRDLASRLEMDAELVSKIEEAVARCLTDKCKVAVDPAFVIVKAFKLASVLGKAASGEGQILVLESGGPKMFSDVSSVFRQVSEKESEETLEVYAPVSFHGEVDKRRKREELQAALEEVILGALATAGEGSSDDD
jgi:uncharacterized protein